MTNYKCQFCGEFQEKLIIGLHMRIGGNTEWKCKKCQSCLKFSTVSHLIYNLSWAFSAIIPIGILVAVGVDIGFLLALTIFLFSVMPPELLRKFYKIELCESEKFDPNKRG